MVTAVSCRRIIPKERKAKRGTAVKNRLAGRWIRPQSQVSILAGGTEGTAVSPAQGVVWLTAVKPEKSHAGSPITPGIPARNKNAKKIYATFAMAQILSNL
jgi:hypothetical protein